MWYTNGVHYVRGQRPRYDALTIGIRYASVTLALVIVVLAAFSYGRLSASHTQAANYEVPGVQAPSSPKLSELKAPPIVNKGVVAAEVGAYLYESGIDQRVSVSVRSLDDDSQATIGDGDYQPASLYKLMLLPVLFEKYDLSDLEKVQLKDMTARQCFDRMLTHSDNCAEELVRRLFGWPAIDNKMQELGYPDLRISDVRGMNVTAQSYSAYIADLYQGKILTNKQTKHIFELLAQSTWQSGIPAGCDECRVMNKTGDKKVRHDSAIIELDGKTYALTILTDGASYAQIADITRNVMDSVLSSQWRTL